jgi:hypothetical protein
VTQLHAILPAYDGWRVPHPGTPDSLTEPQREVNFAAMMAEKPARIATLRAALPQLEDAVAGLLDPQASPVPGIRALEAWWIGELSKIDLVPPVTSTLRRLLRPGAYLAKNAAMATARWDERHDHPLVPKLASLLDDLGLLLGEAMVLRRPDFAWALNHDKAEKRQQTVEWGRICVLRPRLDSFPLKAFALPYLARSAYGLMILDKRGGMLIPAREKDGVWYGRFFGWTVVHIVDGGFTNDYYPDGPMSERVTGRRHRAQLQS